jgi:hypothetical protein
MLFGDPQDFAIEAMIEPELKPPSSVWGRMCIHVSSTVLGDFDDQHCGLYGAYAEFKWLAANCDQLWDASFEGLTPKQIHRKVRHAIYDDDDRTDDQVRIDTQRYSKFDFLTNTGEQFDDYSSVIVSADSATLLILHEPYARLSSKRRLPVDFLIANCSIPGFITASTAFIQWFDKEAVRLAA